MPSPLPPPFKLGLFLCLSMGLGIGILRFSYTALLPATREAFEWSAGFASLLSSANLLGYLIGAFWAMRLPQNKTMVFYIQAAALAGTLSLLSCAFAHFPDSWYMGWRIVSGISGGLLMILSPSVVAQCCEVQHRLKINFIGFSGIGLGILLATLFLPYLDTLSTRSAWLILFGCALLISLILTRLLYQFKAALGDQSQFPSPNVSLNRLYVSLLIVYACSAFAYVPHSLFWVDYLSQVLNLKLYWINMNWMLYGAGSALGAVSAYLLARQCGNMKTLKILYSIYIIGILLAVADFNPLFTLLSSFLTGLLNPAVVFMTSYTILQYYGGAYKKLWGMATLSFAITQLMGGLSFSALQQFGVTYHQQFILAALVLGGGTAQFFWMTSHYKTDPI